MNVTQFRSDPRPDSDVVEALEKALAAAKRGHVRHVMVLTVNPLHETEKASVGQLDRVTAMVAFASLSALAQELLQKIG